MRILTAINTLEDNFTHLNLTYKADKEDNNELNALTVNMDIYIYPSETSLRLSVHNAKGNSYDIGFQKIKATDIGKMYQQLEIIAGSINPEVKELIGNPMGGDICENSR